MNSLETNKELNELQSAPTLQEEITTTTENESQPENTLIETDLHQNLSKKELYDKLALLVEQDVEQVKDEVEHIKQLFYKKNKAEIAAQRDL